MRWVAGAAIVVALYASCGEGTPTPISRATPTASPLVAPRPLPPSPTAPPLVSTPIPTPAARATDQAGRAIVRQSGDVARGGATSLIGGNGGWLISVPVGLNLEFRGIAIVEGLSAGPRVLLRDQATGSEIAIDNVHGVVAGYVARGPSDQLENIARLLEQVQVSR